MILSFLYIVYWVLIFLVCLKIILDSATPSKAVAYIFLVIIFPLIGIIFYFSVGINYRKKKLYKKKLELDKDAFPDLEIKLHQSSEEIIASRAEELNQFSSLANYHTGVRPTSANNAVKALINGEDKFPDLLESIKSARHHIHLEYYIYENDETGSEIAEALIEKAKEGVEVRFIYDDFGSRHIRRAFIARMKKAGVQAFPFARVNLIFFANRLNYRNHRKIVVVDGVVGYVGGINISDMYYNKKSLFWRDTHLKIEGMAVLALQHIFLADWNFCARASLRFSPPYFPVHRRTETFGNQLTQVVDSGPDSRHPNILYSYIQAILLSQKEILITTPYFIPQKSFMDAVKIARLSGVDVKLLVPHKSDSPFVNAACKSYYQELLDVGVEIYRYKKGFVHAKTMVCDGYISVVGTCNLDNRSFDLNFEVNAIVYDHKLAREMRSQFHRDLEVSQKIDPVQWKNRPFLTRTFEKIVHLFSPLL